MADQVVQPRTPAPRVAVVPRQPIFLFALSGALAVLAGVSPDPVPALMLGTSAGAIAGVAAMLAVLSQLTRHRARRALRDAIALISHDPAPCFCTGAGGRIVAQNPAAILRFGDRRGQPMSKALSGLLANAPAVVFRQETALSRDVLAREIVVTRKGQVRITAHRVAAGALWRLDDGVETAQRTGDGIALPMMVVSQNDTILSMNDAMRDTLGRRARSLRQVFGELPLVSGRQRSLGTATGPIDVTPIEIASGDGRREIYLVPAGVGRTVTDESIAARAFESLPVALLHVARDGGILASNGHARALVGLGADDHPRLADLVEGLGRPVDDWLRDTLEERIPNRPEVVRTRRRAEECFVQITLGRIVTSAGPSLLAVLHDATELKTLEQQFVQSQKMQAIGELAGGVAHDFNNLLTAITGHCDLLLLRHDQGDQDYADLVQINQNANRAASLVGQLLAFSRKQTLQPEYLDLRDTMGDLTHLLNRLVGETIRLDLSHDPGLLPIRADRRQLDQVLMNLVVNARDAMPGGGTVRVATKMVRLSKPLLRDDAVVPPGQYVAIIVADEGTGIAPDKIGRIFEPFFTTKRTGEGTGLGLSMAYGIIKQTGGYIFVDSVLGQGATFTIYYPAHDQIAEDLPAAPQAPPIAVTTTPLHPLLPAPVAPDAAPARPAAPPPARDGVVLLVEDEAPVRAFASRALRLRGYTVLEAGNAEEALEQLRDRSLDAFDKSNQEIPNSIFLPKPFSLSDLTATVQRQLH